MTTPDSLDELIARLRALRAAGHPLGLSQRAAQRFGQDASSSGNVATALRRHANAGAMAEALELSQAPDAVRAAHALLPPLGLAAAQRSALRAAAIYPMSLLLAATVLAFLIQLVWSPAARPLADTTGAAVSPGLLLIPALAALGILGLLAAALLSRVRLPLFDEAQAIVERALVLRATFVLMSAGVALPLALRAAARLTHGFWRSSTERLAAELEAGNARSERRGLLDPLRSGLLSTAAARGAAQVSLGALSDDAAAEARRTLARFVSRVQMASLGLAAVAIALIAISFYGQYVRTLGGVGG